MEEPPETFAVYKAINPHQVTGVWVVSFMASLAFTLASLKEELFPHARETFGALFGLTVLWWLGVRLWLYATFPVFRRWRSRLAFQVVGWGELTHQDGFVYGETWCNCTVKIEANNERALEKICLDFCERANREFYPPDVGQPDREKWSLKKGALHGSANCGVAGELYVFIRGPLSSLARRYGVSRVAIKINGQSYTVRSEEIGQT